MNKEEFINYITKQSNYSKKDAEIITTTFSGAISLAISEGHEVNIDDFGKFALKNSKCKTQTKNVPYFTPAKGLKIACN